MVIGSNERSWSVDLPFGPFGQKHPTRSCQIFHFIENIFKIYKKPYHFEFGGGWGLLVFHKYFLVLFVSCHTTITTNSISTFDLLVFIYEKSTKDKNNHISNYNLALGQSKPRCHCSDAKKKIQIAFSVKLPTTHSKYTNAKDDVEIWDASCFKNLSFKIA